MRRGKGRKSARSRKGRAKKNVGKIIKSILSYPGRILKGVTGGMRFAKGGYGAASFKAGGFRNQSVGAIQRRASKRSKRIANVVASSARGAGARAAAVHAARGGYNTRPKSARMTTAKSSRVGMAKNILFPASLPAITPLERKLESMGVRVDKWVAHRSNEICHIEPASQHARWYGVPEFLEQGNTSVPARLLNNDDYAVQNCDLFDIYREHCQSFYDSKLTPYIDPMYATDRLGAGGRTAVTGNQSAAQMFGQTVFDFLGDSQPPTLHHQRGMLHIRNHKVQTHFENVSTIDAFVQEYELVYTEQDSAGMVDQTIGSLDPTNVNIVTTSNASTFSNIQVTYPSFDPTSIWALQTPLMYGPRMGGAMIHQYFMYAKYMLGKMSVQGNLGSLYGGLEPAECSVDQLGCHTKNDPLQAMPPGATRKCAWRLVKVGSVITLKPGASVLKVHPVRKSRDVDVFDLPVIRLAYREDAGLLAIGAPTMYLPKKARVFCFRVWGDMIQSNETTDASGDRDWQTGSPRVMITTDRRMATRVGLKTNQRAAYTTPYQFDVGVDKIHQVAINDETDAPAVVARAGL